jgi:hypothetical protein
VLHAAERVADPEKVADVIREAPATA